MYCHNEQLMRQLECYCSDYVSRYFRGLFYKLLAINPKQYRQNIQRKKSHLWREFQAENKYVCPKPGPKAWICPKLGPKARLWADVHSFSLQFSWEFLFLQYRHFVKIFWRGRETLVKHSPELFIMTSCIIKLLIVICFWSEAYL